MLRMKMKLNDVSLKEVPALLRMLADYRKKLRISSTSTSDISAFVKSLQTDYNGDVLVDEILKLDALLAKHEMYYMGLMESAISNCQARFNIKNNNNFPFYSTLLNNQLESDPETLSYLISIIEHKVDHRFPG